MKIVLDRTRCTGLGMCESLVPDVFEVGDDGDLILHSEDVPQDLRSDIEQAVEACPTAALRLEG